MPECCCKKRYSGIKKPLFRGDGSRFKIELECNRITVKLAFHSIFG